MISRVEVLPKEIKELNFDLFSPYGIELISAKIYDPEDDDVKKNLFLLRENAQILKLIIMGYGKISLTI